MAKILETIKDFIGYIADLIKKHGKTTVINSILIVLITVCVLAVVEIRINNIIPEQFQKYKNTNITEHRENFTKSREFYAELKGLMRQYRSDIGCESMILLEYHNGSENVVTNIQFCKFDVTLDIQDPSNPYINNVDYVNENIYKYDLLLSDHYIVNRINMFSIEELCDIDKHFYQLVTEYSDDVSYVIIANIEYESSPVGMLVFLFANSPADQPIDFIKVTNCVSHIEKEIQRGI